MAYQNLSLWLPIFFVLLVLGVLIISTTAIWQSALSTVWKILWTAVLYFIFSLVASWYISYEVDKIVASLPGAVAGVAAGSGSNLLSSGVNLLSRR